MTEYARVLGGTIIEYAEFEDGVDLTLAPNKGAWLPVLRPDVADFDPETQVKEGPTETITGESVTYAFTVRPKNPAEVRVLKDQKVVQNSAEFLRRNALPITFTLASGDTKMFDADDVAVRRIGGIVTLIGAGAPVPDPYNWTALEELTPTVVTHADMIGLGFAIAAREGSLFVVKKTIDAQIEALGDAASVRDFDVIAAWG